MDDILASTPTSFKAMSSYDGETSKDHWILEPKHKVFLSHSGAQKGFVEQLCKDLEKYDRYPFFDKRRDSLPIGGPFPTLIFEAIQQSQVGVVILSEEFFMRSHWPMTELVKMVEFKKKIMPIFLGISTQDLSDKWNLHRWICKWEVWKKFKDTINIPLWKEALRQLKNTNGLVYNHEEGVVKFREEIVKEINKLVLPLSRWNDSHVQGRLRLCKLIQDKIKEMPTSQSHGVQVLGLYGVGGIGKTTACKSMCNDFFDDFDGRICHLEFGNETTMKDRFQEVLRKLTDTNHKFLKNLNTDECRVLLEKNILKRKVFLAIDNVSDNSMIIGEAKIYLQAQYHHGSIVMVTARSCGELKNLGINETNCLLMPELEKKDAIALFLKYATPKSEIDKGIVMHCIAQCYFCKGDDNKTCHYHPLALKVLGSQLESKDPKEWKLQCKEVDVFNLRREQDNPVFSILRRSFDALLLEDKLLFMDVALFDIGDYILNNTGECSYKPWNIFEWLGMLYGLSEVDVKNRMKALKTKSLLEEVGDGETQIGMHDLWRKFAVMETKCGENESQRWVYELVKGDAIDSSLFDGGWKNLQRICVMHQERYRKKNIFNSVKCLNFNYCTKVMVLRLVDVVVENQSLDLSALKQLKILELFFKSNPYPIVSGIRLLTNLTVLVWLNIIVESFNAIGDISSLINLQVLHLTSNEKDISIMLHLGQLKWLRHMRIQFSCKFEISGMSSKMTNLQVLDLDGCFGLQRCDGVDDIINLEVLDLKQCIELEVLPNLQKLSKLRILDIGDCKSLKAVEGLENVVALQELWAFSCKKLEALPNLQKLLKLWILNISHCTSLKALGGLESIVALQELQAWHCKNLYEVSNLSKLTNLKVLELQGCKSLKCILGLGNLIALQELGASGQLLNDWHDLERLTKLHKVEIRGWPGVEKSLKYESQGNDDSSHQELQLVLNLAMLKSISSLFLFEVHYELNNLSKLIRLQDFTIINCSFKTLSGLSNLTALKSLRLSNCSFLEKLPDMGQLMTLESLEIEGCQSLRRWDGVDTLKSLELQNRVDLQYHWTLPHLKELIWHECEVDELPDLSHFPQLKRLQINPHEDIMFFGISNSSLRCVINHQYLEILCCSVWKIKELPDLTKLSSLKELNIYGCNNLTSLTSSGPLITLKKLRLSHCKNLRVLPDVNLFSGLKKFSLKKCGVKLNVQEVDNLRARCTHLYVHKSSLEFDLGTIDVYNKSISTNGSNYNSNQFVSNVQQHDSLPGPSSLECSPSEREFIPYDELNSELSISAPCGLNDQISLWTAWTGRIMSLWLSFFLCCREGQL